MNWLDTNAEGLAFMLAVFCGMAAMLLLALVVEVWKSRAMRRRRRRREMLRRYTRLIEADARQVWP